ncbi:hypothetical protein I3842_11G144900 [Carya illinoinensis]|uniref:ATP-dependent Clp protease proteolytic subunit n=1 Tax=Carya illinoinensis TaxID=32201 RepID=A0A922IZM9_CARIL|nr:hypothetical protein I3842_11G144900 [Carya illinoinensis]
MLSLSTMLYLDSIDNSKKLYMYINGPGGDASSLSTYLLQSNHASFSVFLLLVRYFPLLKTCSLQLTPSMAIYDDMQSLKSPVGTHCVGYAYNLVAFLLAAGEKGNRFAMPVSRIALQSPAWSGVTACQLFM